MNTQMQILYMQVRLVRLAGEEWGLDLDGVNKLFTENDVYKYIEDFWGIFHVEGDMAVLDDIGEYLKSKGVKYDYKT